MAGWRQCRYPQSFGLTEYSRAVVQAEVDDLLEELQSVGYDFPEGHGTLVEILGSMTDALP